MSEGSFKFKSEVGGIDIHLEGIENWLKGRQIEGSDGKTFGEYDIIDSGLVEWDMFLETKDYGIRSINPLVKNVKISIKDIDENILDINFNCDEYDIHDYLETNIHSFYPRNLYVDLKQKKVEVTF